MVYLSKPNMEKAMKKNYVKVIDICEDATKSKVLESNYEAGMKYPELAKLLECSTNTVKIALGVLGYPAEPWTKPQIDSNRETMRINKERRVKIEA